MPMASALLLASLGAALAAAGDADPYVRLGRALALRAGQAGLESVAVVPFVSLAPEEGRLGELVSERIAVHLSSEEGLLVLDGRQLEAPGAGRSRAPDGPAASEQDVDLYGEVLKQFAAMDLGLQQSFEEVENRRLAARMIRQRLVESEAGVERLKARARKEPPEAQALLTGIVVPLADGRVEVLARLTETERYAVVATVSAKVPKDWGAPPPPAPDPFAGAGPGAAGAGLVAVLGWFVSRALRA